MGGVPALGGMVLPMATSAQRKSLISTESPAAQEMTRGHFVRLSSTNSAAAQQIAQLSKAQAQGNSDDISSDQAKDSEPAWKVRSKPWGAMGMLVNSPSKACTDGNRSHSVAYSEIVQETFYCKNRS
jgi:hypothetical protein